uniref:Uncharacterized protein n=1 Tax=Macrostomum lignano TaxID=282301 RepID=A0A1I8FIE7_9PLAT
MAIARCTCGRLKLSEATALRPRVLTVLPGQVVAEAECRSHERDRVSDVPSDRWPDAHAGAAGLPTAPLIRPSWTTWLLRRPGRDSQVVETVVTEGKFESDIDSESADEENEDEEEDAAGAPTAETAAAAGGPFSHRAQREMHRLSRYRMREMSLAKSPSCSRRISLCAGQIVRTQRFERSSSGSGGCSCFTEASRTVMFSGLSSILRQATFCACYARRRANRKTAARKASGGFHVEGRRRPEAACARSAGKRRVEFFGDDLQPTGHWLVVRPLKPRSWPGQDSRRHTCGVLPQTKSICNWAVHDRTRVFRKHVTGDTFQSPPSQLVARRLRNGVSRCLDLTLRQAAVLDTAKRRKGCSCPEDLPTNHWACPLLKTASSGQPPGIELFSGMKPSRSATAFAADESSMRGCSDEHPLLYISMRAAR